MNRKIALAAGLVTLGLSSLSAQAGHIPGLTLFDGQEFTFDGSAYGIDGFTTEITATAIDFSYIADVDQTQTGATTSTFNESGVAFFSSFQYPLGTPVSALDSGLNAGYKMYTVFTGTGTTEAGGAGIDGTFTSFTLNIYIDDDSNTTTVAAAPGDPDQTTTVGGITTDDVLILTGTLDIGGFHVFGGLANGDFDVLFNVAWYDASVWGGAVFAGTNIQGDITGVNTDIVGLDPANPFATQNDIIIRGSGNVAFASTPVPVPGVLGLLGAGLLGLGWVNGRSRKHA